MAKRKGKGKSKKYGFGFSGPFGEASARMKRTSRKGSKGRKRSRRG